MHVNTKSLVAGIILIALGLIILGDNLGFYLFSWDMFWPWFLIIGGALFLIGWMTDREKYGLLMPASILLTYGFMFLYSSYDGWWHMDVLWPYFLIGPGLGFLLMYFLGKRESGLLIPASILLGLGVIFLMGRGTGRFFWPILIIIIGIILLVKSRRKDLVAPVPPAEMEESEEKPEADKTKKKK